MKTLPVAVFTKPERPRRPLPLRPAAGRRAAPPAAAPPAEAAARRPPGGRGGAAPADGDSEE